MSPLSSSSLSSLVDDDNLGESKTRVRTERVSNRTLPWPLRPPPLRPSPAIILGSAAQTTTPDWILNILTFSFNPLGISFRHSVKFEQQLLVVGHWVSLSRPRLELEGTNQRCSNQRRCVRASLIK